MPGTYDDHPFTIGKDDGDAAVNVEVTWADPNNDWDLEVFKKEADGSLTQVGQSANGNTTKERVSIPNPPAGDYVIRVENFAATGTFDTAVTFDQRAADAPKTQNAAYVGFCAYCDVLNTRPFTNGIATNVLGDKPGVGGLARRLAQGGGQRPAAALRHVDQGRPGRSHHRLRRRSPATAAAGCRSGALGEGVTGADVGTGHVFKSTDGGQNFTDISGNLPDAPAEWTVVRQDQLIVGTDVGVYVSDVNGGTLGAARQRACPTRRRTRSTSSRRARRTPPTSSWPPRRAAAIYKLPLPAVAATTRSVPQAFFGRRGDVERVAEPSARRAPASVHPRRRHQDGVGEGQRAQPAPGLHAAQGAAADRRRVPGLARDHDPRQPPRGAVHEEVEVVHLERQGATARASASSTASTSCATR